MRRRFNRSERNALYLAGAGRCASCGDDLSAGWHADHVQPFSRGGATDVVNGQALCPACNLSKGDRMSSTAQGSEWVARPFQDEFEKWVALKAGAEDNVVMGDIMTGSGKSPAITMAWTKLRQEYPRDDILLAAYTPRVNLCLQAEEDWMGKPGDEGLRHIFSRQYGVSMPGLTHRQNEGPFFGMQNGVRDGGLLSTFSSLAIGRDLHRKELKGRNYFLVGDEAQYLGMDETGGTRAAEAFEELAESAVATAMVTATSNRSDQKPLVLGRYTKPDAKGIRYLIADVTASYKTGVSLGYLRPFEFTLVDGFAQWQHANGQLEISHVNMMDKSLKEFLAHEGYWGPIVDRGIESMLADQMIDPKLCGLIGATTQAHARAVFGYMQRRWPKVRTIIAVSSDGKEAHEALKRFRLGAYDVLITVGMAHIGFDHKPISNVICLSHIREFGWLMQFVGRGLRVYGGVILKCFGPNDPRFFQFCMWMQEQSKLGIKEREERERKGPPPPPRNDGPTLINAGATDWRVIADTPEGDVPFEEMPTLEGWRKAHFPASTPVSSIKKFATELGIVIPVTVRQPSQAKPPEAPYVSAKEQWKRKRSDLSKRMRDFDVQIATGLGKPYDSMFGTTAKACIYAHGGKALKDCKDDADLDARHKWLDEEWSLAVERWTESAAS